MGLIVTNATVEQGVHIGKLFGEFNCQWKFDNDISAEFQERAQIGFRGKWDQSHWTCTPQTIMKEKSDFGGKHDSKK